MDWTIGKRIKSRNILRLQEVNKRKKTEEGSPLLSSSHKKQKRTRPKDYDSDIEDITPANHNNNNNNKKKKSPHVEESDKNLCNVKIESEEDKSVPGSSGLTVKEKLYDVVVGLEAGQSIPNYSVFRNGLEHNTSEKDKLSSATSSSESRH